MNENVNTSDKWIYLKAIVNLLLFGLAVAAVIFLAPYLLIYFMPFVVGAIIAWIAGPLVRFCERKLKLKRRATTATVIILVISFVLTILYLLGFLLFTQIVKFLTHWPLIWDSIIREAAAVGNMLAEWVEQLPADINIPIWEWPSDLTHSLGNLVQTIGVPTVEALSSLFSSLPMIIVNVVMCLLSAYFFIAERGYFSKLTEKIPVSISAKMNIISGSIKQSVGGYFKAQFKIEFWIYLLLVIGLLILRVEYAPLIALGIAIVDVIPVFGAGLILIPWAVVAVINGDYFGFFGLLIISMVCYLVRNFIQPKIMGSSMGVAPIPTLFILYLGFRLGSIFGMLVALPIAIILINMYNAGAFETTQKSLAIIIGGLNRFRRL